MSGGYPHNNPQQNYGYGSNNTQQQQYGATSVPYPANATSTPYPANATSAPYGAPSAPYGAPSAPYGAPSAPYGATSAPSKPQKDNKPSSPYGATSDPYGVPSAPYGATSDPYGAPSAPYGAPSKPHKDNKPSNPYGTTSAPYGAPSQQQNYAQTYGGAGNYPPQPPYGAVPHAYGGGYGGGALGSLVPSGFAPGTDPSIVACFQIADQDGSGMIDDYELQMALSSYNQSFSIRTVHLLMYTFTNSNTRKIGPKEFTALYYSLQNWRSIFERFDRDRSGKIDVGELREALLSLGFSVSPVILDLLVSKFDKTGGKCRAIEYDNFIECCLTVKGLTEKFKEKDTAYSGSATFTYESFMLTVLPFLIA